jgi:NTP pyrophosphatase (non-canonical NTP hydrolase)
MSPIETLKALLTDPEGSVCITGSDEDLRSIKEALDALSDAKHGLTFDELREANSIRLPQFKNSHGEAAHSMPDGSDWTRSDWLEAALGELGEYANFSKKFRRGDIAEAEFMKHATKELADTVTYVDLLAKRLGIDLGEAVRNKFNEISLRVGASVYIEEDGVRRVPVLPT